MKLRNKKTGEIGELSIECRPFFERNMYVIANRIYEYVTLASLFDEWEDVPEELTKSYWFINDLDGEPIECDLKSCGKSNFVRWSERRKQIGNYFGTKEEAEKAVERLKALKRLIDKGVVLHSFEGYEDCDDRYHITFSVRCDRYWSDRLHSVDADLNLLFGGEDD